MSESDARVAEILSEYQDRMTITGAGRAARELAVALARSEEEAADASASLRELQQAAGEYREAVADEARIDSERANRRGTGKGDDPQLKQLALAADSRRRAADAALAALLRVPAEGAKGGG
jgi:hypothetical protein